MKFNSNFYSVFILLISLISSTAFAQFVNNGTTIIIQNNATVFVNGDFSNISGSIVNLGNLTLTGNWSNNDAQGAFNVVSSGNVNFTGQNQTIGGSQPTFFPGVVLTGTGTGIKRLLIDASINGRLNLTDREFALDDKRLNVLNKNTDAIALTTGFISTNSRGILYRNTNSISDYLFPLGSKTSGSLRFRPVSLKVKDNLDNSFGVTFVNNDPSNEGFNRDQKRFDVNEVNPFYFHILDQNRGSSAADFSFYYDNPGDGNFNQLVNWIRFNLWEKAGISNPQPFTSTTNPELNHMMTYSSMQTISSLPIALATITSNNDPITFFNSFTPDGDGINDRWEIKNIDLFPENDLTILNRWGSEVLKVKGYTNGNAWDGLGINNGTYFYILKVNVNGESKLYKGFITLLRND
jgi:gliding motility-associated-like protein